MADPKLLLIACSVALASGCATGAEEDDGSAAMAPDARAPVGEFALDAGAGSRDDGGLDAPDASIDEALEPVPTELCGGAAPRVLWIEPAALSYPRSGAVTAESVRAAVRRSRSLGFETLVVAYVEGWGSCFYYQSELTMPFPTPDRSRTYLPRDGYCSFLPSEDFIEVLMDETERLGMRVILGLGQSGDVYLLHDIEVNLRTAGHPRTAELNQRVSEAFVRGSAVARELHARFGARRSFGGFYLAHESWCLDVAQNLWNPLMADIRSYAPDAFVLISPPVRLSACFGGDSVAARLNALTIDAVAYQDAIGPGYYEDCSGVGHYSCDDTIRAARITGAGLCPHAPSFGAMYYTILENHRGAHAAVWANIEAWNMNGRCADGSVLPIAPGNSCGYGCAHAGPFDRVHAQIAKVRDLVDEMMINEALLAFTFDAPLDLTDDFHRAPAEAFTLAYEACLR